MLRSAFSQAMRWGWVWSKPAEHAHRIVVPPPDLYPPTPAELQHLLDHIRTRDTRFHALVLLAATTGARRAQLLGLTWDHVQSDVRRVAFTRGRVQGAAGSTVSPTKTKRRHSVELSAHTYDTLTLYPPGDGVDEWSVIGVQSAALEADELDELTLGMESLASEFGGVYDGWGAPAG